VTYFGTLQIIGVYIVLGIAADDIFVFVDAWRQSLTVAPEVFGKDKHKRMAYAFRRGVRAMAVTSSTTSVAFFANIFSPLMEIKAFGIFSGIIIPINYFMVVMLFPPAVIIYEKFKCCCCCQREQDLSEELYEKQKKMREEGQEPELQLSMIERIFNNQINTCVFKGRFVILFLSLVWFVVVAITASNMGPQTEQEKFVDDDHPIMEVLLFQRDHFN